MKKPKAKGMMEFITISMSPKGRGPRMMQEDMGEKGERSSAMDLSELLSKMGFPPMMSPMGMRDEMPEEMEDEGMEDEEMEDEMEDEEDNKDLDTVELIQKLIKKLEEHCANMYMTGETPSKKRGK
jgi:rubrerythrin